MRVVAITSSANFARALKAYCEPCGITVTEQAELSSQTANLARVVDAVILHRSHVDGGTISLIERAQQFGFRELFVIATEPIRPEWEERAYLAGASVVAQEPLRAQLLVAQLKRLTSRPPVPVSTPPPFPAETTRLVPAEPASAALELTTTRTMVRLLSQSHDADSFADAFLQHLCDQISVSRLALYLTTFDPVARDLTCVFSTGVDAETFKHLALSLDCGIGGFLRQHGVVLTLSGPLELDSQTAHEMSALGAHVAVPVSDRTSLIGVLLLGRRITGEALRRDEIEVVFHLMSDMGLVLRNARLHRNLTEERAFFASVLDQMGVGSMVLDQQLRVLHANRRMAEAIDHDPAAPMRFEHLPQSFATAVYEIVSGRATETRVHMHHTKGNETFRVSTEPFRLSSAGTSGVIVLTQNYTDVETNRALAIQREREDLLGRMGAQFAHLVRNGLTQISTFAQLLPTKHHDDEFVADLSKRLPGELDRLLHTVDQIEWLNRQLGEPVPVDIQERIEIVWQRALRHRLGDAPLRLSVLIPSVVVLCDPDALDTILLELLKNAVQACGGMGGVELTADTATSDNITLHVHDDGAGFSPEALAHAKEPFFTTKTIGIGLGLTVADRLLQSNGGQLTFGASQRLHGADVAFTLPIPRP